MKKLETKVLALISILGLTAPILGEAADATASDSSAIAHSSTPHKHHRRHKKTKNGSKGEIRPDAAKSSDDSHKGFAASNTDAPGMSNSLGTNNAGSPNMGTSDHVPGTTGTSGQ